MHTWPTVLVISFLFLVVGSSLGLGVWMGARRRREHVPDSQHLGTIQAALLGLLGLILGFSFSGAMSRFIVRQDSLWAEAGAIENAYQRAELLTNGDVVRQYLREYAVLRLELFNQIGAKPTDDLAKAMLQRHESARQAAFEGVRHTPQFATLVIPGMEAVGDEFNRRNAFERRQLPTEMIIVLICASCLSMGTIGYGVGLAERRSLGSAISLAALISVTLFVTIDFDSPRKGAIRLDPTPLENVARALNASPATTRP